MGYPLCIPRIFSGIFLNFLEFFREYPESFQNLDMWLSLWWCSGGWLPNPGFRLLSQGVGVVHVALVANMCQHQGVAVALVAVGLGTDLVMMM